MELLIIRHAQAEDFAMSDSARALTEKGIRQSRKVGEFLLENNLLPDVTIASNYVRARETAEYFCEAAGIDAPLVEPWLGCGMRPESAMRELSAYRDFGRVAICGHNPDFEHLAEWLLGSRAGGIHVRKASVIHFSHVSPPSQGAYLEMMVPVSVI